MQFGFSAADFLERPVENQVEEPLDIQTGNIDCPSCDLNLRVLAGQIPMSHHVNSTIVCRISGEVMDSENEPLAFPNGNVYSSKVSGGAALETTVDN